MSVLGGFPFVANLFSLYLLFFESNCLIMKKLILISVVAFSFSSCRNSMDSCIQRAMDDGMSRSEAKEMCEDGRDDSFRR